MAQSRRKHCSFPGSKGRGARSEGRTSAASESEPRTFQPMPPRLTENPWFWLMLFGSLGAVGVVVIGPKYAARMARMAPSTTAGSVSSVCLPSVRTTRGIPALILTAILRASRNPCP